MTTRQDPYLDPDDAALALARGLWRGAATASLAFADPADGLPFVSRIGFGTTDGGQGLTLVSALSTHTAALRASPDAAVLLSAPDSRGDPLNAPRLSVRVRARFVDAAAPERAGLRETWLRTHPKARLYIDFADFAFVVLDPAHALLNGGFARAYRLSAADLAG